MYPSAPVVIIVTHTHSLCSLRSEEYFIRHWVVGLGETCVLKEYSFSMNGTNLNTFTVEQLVCTFGMK
jgi:hypothetical protein